MELTAISAREKGGRNFLVAVLPHNKAVEHCRNCIETAERLSQHINTTVTHRLYRLPTKTLPFFVIEKELPLNKNLFLFPPISELTVVIGQELERGGSLLLYRIDEPFSVPPLTDSGLVNLLRYTTVSSVTQAYYWMRGLG